MKKKYYAAPLTEVLGIDAGNLLQSNSLPIDKNNEEEPVSDPSEVYSRRQRNVWDDECEDDELATTIN